MSLLLASNLQKCYGIGKRKIEVLRDINLEINEGEMTAIIGASGSGKTTLLQILGTLDTPDSGDLFFEGEPLYKKNGEGLAAFRNKSIGFIFQFHHLLPDFTALENVMMPARIAGVAGEKKGYRQKAEELLEKVELGKRMDHKVAELSGGEQQRTALARALIMSPSIILADEPTGNLDQRAGNIVFSLLKDLCREQGLATVMVTHNNELASQMDLCLTLQEGRLVS